MWYHDFLDIACEARPDAWGGVGVFATQRIPKGELVESGVVQRLCDGKYQLATDFHLWGPAYFQGPFLLLPGSAQNVHCGAPTNFRPLNTLPSCRLIFIREICWIRKPCVNKEPKCFEMLHGNIYPSKYSLFSLVEKRYPEPEKTLLLTVGWKQNLCF